MDSDLVRDATQLFVKYESERVSRDSLKETSKDILII